MPTLPNIRNIASTVTAFRDKLGERTSITNFDRDSKTRALMDTVADEFVNLDRQQVLVYNADRITTATGEDLDRVCRRIGLSRYQSRFATVSSSENNLVFYVESGTFGTINGGSDIIVPSGTVIRTVPQNNELGQRVEYQLSESVTLTAASGIGFASARAVISGRGSNLGTGTLVTHGFTGYVDAANNTLKVNNTFPILNGQDLEPDELFRGRATFFYSSLLQNNDSKIRLQGLQVPGVIEIKPIDGYFGIGTTGVIVLGAENQSVGSLLASVQQRIDSFKTPGAYIRAIAATSVSFDMELEVRTGKALTENNQTRLKANIRRSLLDSMRRVGLGGTINFSDLTDLLISNVLTGVSLRSKRHDLFKNLYVRKGYSNSSLDGSKKIVNPTYSLEQDEYATLGNLDVSFIVRP